MKLSKLFMATASLALTAGMANAEVVINRGNDSDPSTLDHHKTSTVSEGRLSYDLFEGLVTLDAESNTIPGVAESWEISEDGKVYTFKLRQDAKWSNGDIVTANDFEYAFKRLMNPETAAGYASVLYAIKNSEAVNGGTQPLDDLGVKALDDFTFEITLENPTPYFLELLTHKTGLPVHKASVEQLGNDYSKPGNMISNGAYTLESFSPNDKIVLKKNPNFHDADGVQIGRAHV